MTEIWIDGKLITRVKSHSAHCIASCLKAHGWTAREYPDIRKVALFTHPVD